MNPNLPLRLVVIDPPAGVAFAVQASRDGLLAPSATGSDALVFEFSLSVSATVPTVRLTGEFAQGPPAGRFVYVNSGTLAGQDGSCWSRRAKVPLTGITAAHVHAALQPGRALEARIAGTGQDGGPNCATVSLLSAWTDVAA